MEIIHTKNYLKQIRQLPQKYRKIAVEYETILKENIFHSKLHTKKLHGIPNDSVFSFRITRLYRGIFRIDDNRLILFAIGHRKDIYNSAK